MATKDRQKREQGPQSLATGAGEDYQCASTLFHSKKNSLTPA